MATTARPEIETAAHTIHGRLSPFGDIDPVISYQAEVGRTISEIVAAAPGVPDWFWLAGEVRINAKCVAREVWDTMRPKMSRPDRPIIITLHPVYRGGGGGGSSTKNIAVTVAAIALVVGATLVSGGLLGPVVAGGIGTGLAGAAFLSGVGGSPLSPCTIHEAEIIRGILKL